MSKLDKILERYEIHILIDEGENCSCDAYGDIWMNNSFIQEIASQMNISKKTVFNVLLSHEIGHSIQIYNGFKGDNEIVAWLIGRQLFKKVWGSINQDFLALEFECLRSYRCEESFSKWQAEVDKIHSEVMHDYSNPLFE